MTFGRKRKPAKRRMPWQRRNHRWIAVITLFVVIPILALTILRAHSAQQVRNELALMAPLGYVSDQAEIEALFPVPPEELNGAPLLVEAFKALQPVHPREVRDVPLLGEKSKNFHTLPVFTPAHIEKVEKIFAENTLALELLDAALAKPAFGQAFDAKNFWQSQESLVDAITHFLNTEDIRAILALQRGDMESATSHLVSMVQMNFYVALAPRLHAFVIAARRFEGYSLPLVVHALEQGTMTHGQLERLDSALAMPKLQEYLRHMFLLQTWRLANGQHFYRSRGDTILKAVGLADYQLAPAVQIYRNLIELYQQEPSTWHEAFLELKAPYGDFGHIPWRDALATNVIYDEQWYHDARLRLALLPPMLQTVLAIEKYRLAHSTLPESLEALVPTYRASIPTDILGDGPIQYEHQGGNYSVFSVGREDRQARFGDDEVDTWSIRVKHDGQKNPS